MSGSDHVYHVLTVWSRVIIMDKEARDVSSCVAADAVGLAEQRERSPWMFVRNLSELALDRMSTEGAEERLAIGMGIAAPLIGALTAATGELPVDTVAAQVADRDAMLRGAAKYAVVDFTAAAGEQDGQVSATPAAHATTAD